MNTSQQSTSLLKGQHVLIIGGSSGLGLATAMAAAAEGARVTIASASQARLNAALQQLPAGSEARLLDVSNQENIKTFFGNIGSIDHLVYTAGENIVLNDLAATQLQQAADYFTIRYWGAVACVKHAAAHINKGGSITLTSGIASQRPGKGWWLGASICSAMEGFAKGMAVELAPIRVNAVSPGVVRSNLWNSLSETERNGLYSATAASLPVQRVGETADLAQTYLYCMKQGYGTGQIITVDGGAMRV